MNSWESVWDYIRQRVEPKLAVSVGLEWLSRARWDLRTWPSIAFKTVVLAKEADDLRLLSDRLDRWLELPFSSPKSRAEVRKAKSLLVDKLEAAT